MHYFKLVLLSVVLLASASVARGQGYTDALLTSLNYNTGYPCGNSGSDQTGQIQIAFAQVMHYGGGTVDLMCYESAVSISADIFSTVTANILLYLPNQTVTINANATIPSNFEICGGPGSSIVAGGGFTLTNNASKCFAGYTGGGGGGSGTVTSVGLSAPSVFTVTGSPVTVSGVLGLTFATGQPVNEFLGTGSGGVLGLQTITAAGLPSTIVYDNQANTYTTGIQNLAAATDFYAPTWPGGAGAHAGDFLFDSTFSNYHGFANAHDSIFASFGAALAPVNGDCVTWVSVAGNYLLGDFGGNCGSGGGGSGTVTSFSAGNFSSFFTTSVATSTTTPVLSFVGVSNPANEVAATPNGGSGVLGVRALVNADLPAPVVYNNQANTYTTGIQNFAAATDFYTPTGAGAAGTHAGDFLFDSTASNYHGYASAHDSIFASFLSSLAPVNGDCVTWVSVAGNYLLGDFGGNCGSGGGSGTVTSFSAGNFSSFFTTSVATSTTTPVLSFVGVSNPANEVAATPNGGSGVLGVRALVNADLPAPVVYNNQANTYTTGIQNFAAATDFYAPTGAGAAGTHAGDFLFDSTANNYHGYANGNDSIFASFGAALAPVNGHCVTWVSVGGNYLLGDFGNNCGSGGGGSGTVTSFSAGNFSPFFTTSVATSTTTPALSFAGVTSAANLVAATPNGSAGPLGVRALVPADFPFLEPNAGTPVRYADYYGSNSNDGLTPATAKADAIAAHNALPSAGGTVYLRDGGPGHPVPATSVGGCDAIRIGGSNDPNYASFGSGSYACWVKAKTAVNFIGVGGSVSNAFAIGPQTSVAMGSTSVANDPSIWLSDVFSYSFLNLTPVFPRAFMWLGVDSNGSPSDLNAGSWDNGFFNVGGRISNTVGYGPTIRIGTNSSWNFFNFDQLEGNAAETVAITSLSRTSGITTATTAGLPSSWTGTMNIGVIAASDPSFSGLFSATIANSTQFTYSQSLLANGTATGGRASSDASAAVLVNEGGSSNQGNGFLFFSNSFFSVTGVRAYAGGSGLGLSVNNSLQENGVAPQVQISGCAMPTGSVTGSLLQNDQVADNVASPLPGARVDNPGVNCPNTAVEAALISIDGPFYNMGGAGPSVISILPDVEGQTGIYEGRLYAQEDTARRGFGPVAARFLNLATQVATNWGTNPGGGTCSSLATIASTTSLDGNATAGHATVASGSGMACFASAAQTLTVGQNLVYGVWARSDNSNGFAGAVPIQLSCTGCTLSTGVSYSAHFESLQPNAAQWTWYGYSATVATSTGSNQLSLFGNVDSTHPADFDAPVLNLISASAMAPNEVAEYTTHLQSYRDDATVGQVSLLRGEQFKADSAVIPTLTGNASTASALATLPTPCTSGEAAGGILANGNSTDCLQVSTIVGSGTYTLNPGALASGACAATVSVPVTGATTSMRATISTNQQLSAVAGFIPSTSGLITIYPPFITAGHINFDECNSTANPVTPGSVAVAWTVQNP